MEAKKHKHVVVAWSCGHDSTLALIGELIKSKANKETQTTITAVYIELHNNESQYKVESSFIEYIYPYIRDKYGSYKLATGSYIKNNLIHGHTGPAQAPMWASMFGTMKCDELVFGYVGGDCMWYYREQFEKIIRNTRQILYDDGDSFKISYPLRTFTKVDIINQYKEANCTDLYVTIKNSYKLINLGEVEEKIKHLDNEELKSKITKEELSQALIDAQKLSLYPKPYEKDDEILESDEIIKLDCDVKVIEPKNKAYAINYEGVIMS